MENIWCGRRLMRCVDFLELFAIIMCWLLINFIWSPIMSILRSVLGIKPKPPERKGLIFRYANPYDLPQLLELERVVDQTDYYDAESFSHLIVNPKYGIVVVEDTPLHLLGYLAFETRNSCSVILSVVVRPSYQRRGVGTQLINCLKSTSWDPDNYRPSLYVNVRSINLEFQCFLRENGFVCQHIEPDAFSCPSDDAYQFKWKMES